VKIFFFFLSSCLLIIFPKIIGYLSISKVHDSKASCSQMYNSKSFVAEHLFIKATIFITKFEPMQSNEIELYHQQTFYAMIIQKLSF